MATASIFNVIHHSRDPGYLIGLGISLLLHGCLLALLIAGWAPEEKERQAARPRYIEAKLLQLKPAVAAPQKPKPQAKPKPQPKVDESAAKRAAEQQRREQLAKAESEKKHREQQAKAEAEKKRQELERQNQIKRDQAEKRRQEEVRRQQELARAMALEEEFLDEEAVGEQVGTYVDYMASLIASNWSRPPSARLGMEVVLEISLGAAGRVTSVQILKSSGNPAFDRSAEQAVWKVQQFTRLKEMDAALYQRDFRRVRLIFSPEDLRM